MSKLACIIIGILSALTVSAIAGNEEDGLAKLFSSFRFARSAIPAERDSKKFRKDDKIKKRSLSKHSYASFAFTSKVVGDLSC